MNIHIKGWGKDINLLTELSDNYDLGVDFNMDEETTDTIPNVAVQIYRSSKECSLEKAMEGHLRLILGDLDLTGMEYGYSEYTIMGFDVSEAKIGDHKLEDIVNSYPDQYLHILIKDGVNEV